MFGMTDEDHRAHTVAGFHQLADFLHTYSDMIPLNTASRIDVQYSILEEDDAKAHEEFAELADVMYRSSVTNPQKFTESTNVYDTCTHHIAQLTFGAGTVAYRVVWIEKTGEGDEQ
jgi:hypothetical protein